MAGNGCYWGFETRGNRIAWSFVVLFVVIGAAFWIPGVIEVKKCINAHTICVCPPQPSGGRLQCLDRRVPSELPQVDRCYEAYIGCMRRPAAVWGVGWFFLVICSWVPCCYFCCCSQNPKTALPIMQYGVQMSAVPGQPYSSPYGYPAPPTAAAAFPPTAAFPASGAAQYGTAGFQQQQQQQGLHPGSPYQGPASPYVDSNAPVTRY